jgi:hypothetical protein
MAKSSLEITLYSGSKFDFEVDSRVAQAVAKHHGTGGVFFAIEGGEVFSVNLESVVAIHGAPSQADTEAPQETSVKLPPLGINAVGPSRTGFRNAAPQQDEPGLEKALYKIECKCGAEYFAKMYADTEKCRCRECNDRLYVDKFAPKQYGDNKEPATLATNRYKVPFVNGTDIA